MSIMFLEGAYPSPGEVYEGRLQLVEVGLHTHECGPSAQMLPKGQDQPVHRRDTCFEPSILGAAYCSRTGCEEPGLLYLCKGEAPSSREAKAGLDVEVPVLPASNSCFLPLG